MDNQADVRTTIEQKLTSALAPDFVDVIDQSAAHAGHAGAASGGGHYRVILVAGAFEGLNQVERHRRVYEVLAAEMQSAVLEILGIGAEEAEAKFGFLLTALGYGCPPHGGIAFGLDRIVMLMAGASSLRDVIAFPKTQTANDLLTGAPGPVDAGQLKELSLRVRKPSGD